MIEYTTEDVQKLIKIAPKTKSWSRKIKPVYSYGGLVVGFEKGLIEYEEKICLMGSIEGFGIFMDRWELHRILTEKSEFDRHIHLTKNIKREIEIRGLLKIKELLWNTTLDEVPLWINTIPNIVKWRLEIGK